MNSLRDQICKAIKSLIAQQQIASGIKFRQDQILNSRRDQILNSRSDQILNSLRDQIPAGIKSLIAQQQIASGIKFRQDQILNSRSDPTTADLRANSQLVASRLLSHLSHQIRNW